MLRFALAGLAALGLCACQAVSYQPSPAERGVKFPLEACNEERLRSARHHLVDGQDSAQVRGRPDFTDEWVCVTSPLSPDLDEASPHRQAQAALQDAGERSLRRALEQDFLPPPVDGRPALGIALAGGGSKAAAFGTGVLAGLADAGWLDKADMLSTVSGGSYAAYFYYTHRILPLTRSTNRERRNSNVRTVDLFRDCVQRPPLESMDAAVWSALGRYGACDLGGIKVSPQAAQTFDDAHYQAYLRCQQDVFNPGLCSTDPDLQRLGGGLSPLTLAGTIALAPIGLVGNVLFDWGINVSQAGRTYARGIGMSFGTTLTSAQALPSSEVLRDEPTLASRPAPYVFAKIPCSASPSTTEFALDCHRGLLFDASIPLTFEELRAAALQSRHASARSPMPFWILNATAPRYRSFYGWWAPAVEDTANQDMFEMTAVSHGSPRFGYVSAPMNLHNMHVLDAVAASAAFADSAQLAITGRIQKGLLGMLLRTFNFDWGADVANYNVSDSRRRWHKALPFPLYWTDSFFDHTFGTSADRPSYRGRTSTAYIRIIDGGNSENLGLYALMRRKTRTIVLADSAQDGDGHFVDLCAFRARLAKNAKEFPVALHVPGLRNFHKHCDDLLRKEGGQARSYPIREWKLDFPVLVACMRAGPPPNPAQPCAELDASTDSHMLIVKPAINLGKVVSEQTAWRPQGVRQRFIESCAVPGGDAYATTQLLNCDATAFLLADWNDGDGPCQRFPQHATAITTLNSSSMLFGAYRELARQYVMRAATMLEGLMQGDDRLFQKVAGQQAAEPMDDAADEDNRPTRVTCDRDARPAWLVSATRP